MSRREIWRLADSVDMLLTVGLLKIYQAGRRFHYAVDDAERLEVPGRCPHENFPSGTALGPWACTGLYAITNYVING